MHLKHVALAALAAFPMTPAAHADASWPIATQIVPSVFVAPSYSIRTIGSAPGAAPAPIRKLPFRGSQQIGIAPAGGAVLVTGHCTADYGHPPVHPYAWGGKSFPAISSFWCETVTRAPETGRRVVGWIRRDRLVIGR